MNTYFCNCWQWLEAAIPVTDSRLGKSQLVIRIESKGLINLTSSWRDKIWTLRDMTVKICPNDRSLWMIIRRSDHHLVVEVRDLNLCLGISLVAQEDGCIIVSTAFDLEESCGISYPL